MKMPGIVWKNGVSFFLTLSFLLLLISSFTGCGKSDDPVPARSFSPASRAAFKAAVDTALANATNKRGISVAIYKNGYAMWTYASGYADGDFGSATGTAMTTATPTFAYSITKTFVSALVLTQIHHGLYTLDDTVDDLLSTNADYRSLSEGQQARINKSATVKQLLNHTSGMLESGTNVPAEIAMCDPAYTTWKPVDILERIVNQPLSAPGIFHYSNTNYVLLGMIAEEKGEAPLNMLLAAAFFSKLGINAILAPQDIYLPSNIAHPYDDAFIFYVFYDLDYPLGSFRDFSEVVKLVDPSYDFYLGIGRSSWAAGGIVATAAQLAKWGNALYDPNGSAITVAVRERLKNSAPDNGSYGYGVEYTDFEYRDGTIGGTYGHNGNAPGWKTSLRYEKAKGITVVILTNANNSVTGHGLIDQGALAESILNSFAE